MILNIVALVFILGITFVHSLFGLYSGIISLFCCLVALAVAFGYFEPLTLLLAEQKLPGTYVEPGAIALLFFLTLLILRLVADRFLRRNVRVPAYLDWAGGAACGFAVGQICVGVAVISFLMLPWGGRALGFSRYERDEENRTYRDAMGIPPELMKQEERVVFHRNNLWLQSDALVAGLFHAFSHGSLRGQTAFGTVYPDFVQWVFWSGNAVQPECATVPERDERLNPFERGIKVDSWWEIASGRLPQDTTRYRKVLPSAADPKPAYEPLEYRAKPGSKLVGLRVQFFAAVADRDKGGATVHRFRPTQFRLVGDVTQPDGSLEPRHYIAQVIGGADPNVETDLRIADIDANFSLFGSSETKADIYFEVEEQFQPRFVEYRRHVRASVPAKSLAKTPPEDKLVAPAAPVSGKSDKATGPARFVDVVNRAASGDKNELPFAFKLDKLQAALDVELEGKVLASARVTGDRATLLAGDKEPEPNKVNRLKPPEDKRVFQLQVKARRAKSLPGQILNYVGGVTNQYSVKDAGGESHLLIGYYAIVKKGNDDYIEFVYLPDDPSFRQMLDFRDDSVRKALEDQENALLGLIFAVPAGRELIALSSGGGEIAFGQNFKVGQ